MKNEHATVAVKNGIHIPYLDGWRGIAIICVLLAHFANAEWSGIGVSIFFVLSGILMSRILFVEKMPLAKFYRRRGARIIPAFWLYIIVVFTGFKVFLNEFNSTEFFSTLFFFRTYFPNLAIFKSNFPIAHIWSLNVEEHSYILLSFISLLAFRFSEKFVRLSLLALSFLCLVFFVYYKYNPPAAQSLFILRSEVAAFPLLLSSAIFMWLHKYPIKVPTLIPILTLICAFIVAFFSNSIFLSYFLTSAFLAISVNTLSISPLWFQKILSNSILRWLGVCSFSNYLWQQLFYFCGRYANNWSYYHFFAVISTLIISSCSFYLFENPVRKWLAGRP